MTMSPRTAVKSALSRVAGAGPAQGATLLIYHRVGGGSRDELDLPTSSFARQVKQLAEHRVLSLDAALDDLDAGRSSPSVVLTFDDGFADVFDHAWPLLRDHQLPFTIYLASAFMGTTMKWEGSTAGGAGSGLTWDHLAEMVASGLCTIGNHTHDHVPPDQLDERQLDLCTATIQQHLGVIPQHFTFPWGLPVPTMEAALYSRFRSASTGRLGRNLPGYHPMQLRRVPVRQSDPDNFFAAKLRGTLLPERTYAALVSAAKRLGLKA